MNCFASLFDSLESTFTTNSSA